MNFTSILNEYHTTFTKEQQKEVQQKYQEAQRQEELQIQTDYATIAKAESMLEQRLKKIQRAYKQYPNLYTEKLSNAAIKERIEDFMLIIKLLKHVQLKDKPISRYDDGRKRRFGAGYSQIDMTNVLEPGNLKTIIDSIIAGHYQLKPVRNISYVKDPVNFNPPKRISFDDYIYLYHNKYILRMWR